MQGKIPAVFYGPDVEATPLTISPADIIKILRGPYGRNALIEMEIHGKTELALVRDLDQDPVTHAPLHVDFYRVSLDKPVDTHVPFELTGRALGVQKGGILNVTTRSLPVRGTPDVIPAKLEHDVSELDKHEALTVADLSLPEGLTISLPPTRTLGIIVEPRRAVAEETEETEGEAEVEAPEA
jgi:large subunit ribosomal protein L25